MIDKWLSVVYVDISFKPLAKGSLDKKVQRLETDSGLNPTLCWNKASWTVLESPRGKGTFAPLPRGRYQPAYELL